MTHPSVDPQKLEKLAEVAVRVGLQLQKGQDLVMTAPIAALPLVRWRLFRLAPERHVLVHVEHHLLHDGWSFVVLLGDLFALYRANAGGVFVNFYYSDMRNYFCTGSYSRSSAEAAGKTLSFHLASLQRYKFHEFRAVPDYRTVWDSAAQMDKAGLHMALAEGRRLKLAVQIDDDLWIVQRIAHARHEEGGHYRFVTPAIPVPNFLAGERAMFDGFPAIAPGQGLSIQSGVLQAGLSPSTDGTCVWYGSDLVPGQRPYRTLRIFEKL